MSFREPSHAFLLARHLEAMHMQEKQNCINIYAHAQPLILDYD